MNKTPHSATGGDVNQRLEFLRRLHVVTNKIHATTNTDEIMLELSQDICDLFGADRLTIALDTRQADDGVWRLPVHGWTETADVTLDALATRYAQAGMKHLLCTDIARDGMLSGPNIDLYAHLSKLLPSVVVQASGGVRDVNDVAAAKSVGCGGAVLGKALLEGRLQLSEALAC